MEAGPAAWTVPVECMVVGCHTTCLVGKLKKDEEVSTVLPRGWRRIEIWVDGDVDAVGHVCPKHDDEFFSGVTTTAERTGVDITSK